MDGEVIDGNIPMDRRTMDLSSAIDLVNSGDGVLLKKQSAVVYAGVISLMLVCMLCLKREESRSATVFGATAVGAVVISIGLAIAISGSNGLGEGTVMKEASEVIARGLEILGDPEFYSSGYAMMLLMKSVFLFGLIVCAISYLAPMVFASFAKTTRSLLGKKAPPPTYVTAKAEDYIEGFKKKEEEIRRKAAAKLERARERKAAEMAQQEKKYQLSFPGKSVTLSQDEGKAGRDEAVGSAKVAGEEGPEERETRAKGTDHQKSEEQRQVEEAEGAKAAAKALKRSSESQRQAEEDRKRAEEARAAAAAAASRREAAAEEDIRRRAAELARLEAEKKALSQKKLIAELEAKQRRYQMPYRGEGRTTAGEPSVSRGHQGGGGGSGDTAAFRDANCKADVAPDMKQRGEEAKQKREWLESARANILRLMKEKTVWEEEQKVELGRLRRSEMQLKLGRLSDESLQAAVEQEVSENRKKVEEVEAKGKVLEEQMEAAKQELAAAEDALQGK